MNDWPYHEYLFFALDRNFYSLAPTAQTKIRAELKSLVTTQEQVWLIPYATLGFGPDSTFMLWARSHKPEHIQDFLKTLRHSGAGQYLALTSTLFGITRRSQYSRGPANHDQVIQANERLPYLIIYPFTKTPGWHVLPFEERGRMMGAHIKIGKSHKSIRQCLLYAYGVDNHEFIVSYETPTLEEFQDLVMELRTTEGRLYTQNDLPLYTCVYKSAEELFGWL